VFLSDDGLRVWLEAREREARGRKRAGGVRLCVPSLCRTECQEVGMW